MESKTAVIFISSEKFHTVGTVVREDSRLAAFLQFAEDATKKVSIDVVKFYDENDERSLSNDDGSPTG